MDIRESKVIEGLITPSEPQFTWGRLEPGIQEWETRRGEVQKVQLSDLTLPGPGSYW